MYDVVHLDRSNRSRVIACGLDRTAAVDLARVEAARRRVGRMFLAGSEPRGECVLIVPSAPERADLPRAA
jgi:hypothetical protein